MQHRCHSEFSNYFESGTHASLIFTLCKNVEYISYKKNWKRKQYSLYLKFTNSKWNGTMANM